MLLSYDGLGFLRAVVDGSLPQPPITERLGFRLVGAEHGKAIFQGIPEFRHYNPPGVVHAGFAATLLDSAVFYSVQSTLAKGETFTTLKLKLNLVPPLAHEIGPVRAEGHVVHRGRTIATAGEQLRDRAGKLCAHASTTRMIFPARS